MPVLAILAEKWIFFALWDRFTLPTVESISPSVVVHLQEPPGKTGYSALVCISFYPLEEWQESGLILLNWQEVGIMECALSNFGQIRQIDPPP